MPSLRAFWEEHPQSKNPLKAWYKLMRSSDSNNLSELKQEFVVDYVPPRFYVFDLAGNKYRLVALVNFVGRRVLIEKVMTHNEYDR